MKEVIKHHPMPYLKPLDGIRAVAIIGVLIFHISPQSLRGGYMGVDVFFVLSGFLITSILLLDFREESFSMREFYLRRIQRLLPNLVFTVFVVLCLWTIFLTPAISKKAGSHGLWTLFSASNIYVWRNLGGYWGSHAEGAPLTHTWSLGIEEQFYLLFPCFLLLLIRWQPNRVAFWLAIAAVLSFSLCLYGSYTEPVATFYLLPTRVWELLIGALLAANRTPVRHSGDNLVSSLQPRVRTAIGWLGISMIAASFVIIRKGFVFPGWVCLIPTVGTALLLFSIAEGESRLARWLSSRFMVGTGKLSYSLYLWHWPFIIFGKMQADLYGFPLQAGAIVGGISGVILACFAYVYVEQPLRNRAAPGRRWRMAAIGGGFAIVLVFSSLVSLQTPADMLKGRFDRQNLSIGLYDAGNNSGTPRNNDFWPVSEFYFAPAPAEHKDAWKTGGVKHLYDGGLPKIVIFGSSHALMYSKLIDDLCREMKISVAFLGVGGGTPAFFETRTNTNFPLAGEAKEFDETRKKWLKEWRPKALFVIDRWDGGMANQLEFEGRLRSYLKEVSPWADRVVWVAQVPVIKGAGGINMREFINSCMVSNKDLPRLYVDEAQALRMQTVDAAEKAALDFKNMSILRADIPFYREGGSLLYSKERSLLYFDSNHLSDEGAEVVRDLFQKAISESCRTSVSP